MRAESCKMFPWPVLGCGEHKFPWEPSGFSVTRTAPLTSKNRISWKWWLDVFRQNWNEKYFCNKRSLLLNRSDSGNMQ